MRLTGFGYGTATDRHDSRDFIYDPPARLKGHLPKRVDLRPHMPPVYNQHHLNSCSANAIAAERVDGDKHHVGPGRHSSLRRSPCAAGHEARCHLYRDQPQPGGTNG
jgi:hypothetical protein